MSRKPTTPAVAQANAREHATAAREAADVIAAVLGGTWEGDDADRAAAVLGAAKAMEAAGCYIRRANAKGLLT